LFSHPCIDTGSFSIRSVVSFQSDGTPLLRLRVQVTVDNRMLYLYYTGHKRYITESVDYTYIGTVPTHNIW